MTDDSSKVQDQPLAGSSVGNNGGWRVARILTGGIDGLCVVSDLTAGDAKVMSRTPLAVDEQIVLDLGHGERVSGQVRWADGTRCGLEFDPPIDPAVLVHLAGADTPAPQFKRCVSVSLERHGRLAAARLVEISPTNASLELPREPWIRDGAELEVDIEGFYPAEAEVSWIDGERIGIAFRTPMQLWRLDNQLREWARDCQVCSTTGCHTGWQPQHA